MQRTFTVKALWDEEAQVFVSQSDIQGLHIEAASIEEFEAAVHEYAVELIIANHITAEEIASTPFKDLVPGIVWQRPDKDMVAA